MNYGGVLVKPELSMFDKTTVKPIDINSLEEDIVKRYGGKKYGVNHFQMQTVTEVEYGVYKVKDIVSSFC